MSLFARLAMRRLAFSRASSIASPRTFTTFTHIPIRSTQRLLVPALSRRFASENAAPPSAATTTDETVPEPPSQSEVEAQQSSSAQGLSDRYSNPPENKSLYVGNLFFEVTEAQLKQEFEKIGPVESTKIIYDHRGLSKGFGYVVFSDIENAASAIEKFNQTIFEGRRLVVQYHVPRAAPGRMNRVPNAPSKTLFIGNLSFEMSDRDLNELFREIKNVLDVRVAIDRRSGQPRGFAHADFIDVKSAEQAKEILSGKEIYGRKLRVDFSATSRNPPNTANTTTS